MEIRKCSTEAYAQCQFRASCGPEKDAKFVAGSECDRFNQEIAGQEPVSAYPQTQRTYADVIRGMPDELLARYLMEVGGITKFTYEQVLEVLRSPVE